MFNYFKFFNNLLIVSIIIGLLLVVFLVFRMKVDYYRQIVRYRRIPDFTRWILSDKYIAKRYAEINGFSVPETYQLVKYPHNIDFSKLDFKKGFVIKPTDLCSSKGVYLIKNGRDLFNGGEFNKEEMIKELNGIRCKIGNEYFMHDLMFGGLVPFSGLIVEELLLDDEGMVPVDYKCYAFQGRVYLIAMTYNRRFKDGKQEFDSVWLTRDWRPIRIPMKKKNYKYRKSVGDERIQEYSEMIRLVEAVSKKLERHCRIDVYCIGGKVYLGEFTFFCGARIHTAICNLILGVIWMMKPDNYLVCDERIMGLIPDFYNLPYIGG